MYEALFKARHHNYMDAQKNKKAGELKD